MYIVGKLFLESRFKQGPHLTLNKKKIKKGSISDLVLEI